MLDDGVCAAAAAAAPSACGAPRAQHHHAHEAVLAPMVVLAAGALIRHALLMTRAPVPYTALLLLLGALLGLLLRLLPGVVSPSPLTELSSWPREKLRSRDSERSLSGKPSKSWSMDMISRGLTFRSVALARDAVLAKGISHGVGGRVRRSVPDMPPPWLTCSSWRSCFCRAP